MAEFIRVAGTDEVKPGTGIVAEVGGKVLAVSMSTTRFMSSTIRACIVEVPWERASLRAMWCPARGMAGNITSRPAPVSPIRPPR